MFGTAFLKEVKQNCSALGDYQLLNNSLFYNYSHCCSYFDDNMEKTACFVDLLSRCDNMTQFVFKHQAQEMQYEFQWLPSFMFKKYCGGERKYNVYNR